MTNSELIAIAAVYEEKLSSFEPIRMDKNKSVFSSMEKFSHARFMCREIPVLVEQGSIAKANRWLGFVQGVLWTSGIHTIGQLRDDNRSSKPQTDPSEEEQSES